MGNDPARPDLAVAHAELLRAALAAATPFTAQVVLDLASGTGQRTPCLAEAALPDALLLSVDNDHASLSQSVGDYRLVADAHQLPLRSASVDLVWCVAALRLFTLPQRALSEVRRVLRTGGALVVTVAGERWVRRRFWAPQASPPLPLPPADDLGAELLRDLYTAGFQQTQLAAYLLDPPGLDLCAASLPLADMGTSHLCALGEPEIAPILLVATALA